MVEKTLLGLLRVVALIMLLLVLPKLNSTATCPVSEDVVVGFVARRRGEEGDDADAECSGGVE